MGYYKNPEEMHLHRAKVSRNKADSYYAKYCAAKEDGNWALANHYYEKSQQAYADEQEYLRKAEESKGMTFAKNK